LVCFARIVSDHSESIDVSGNHPSRPSDRLNFGKWEIQALSKN
jgi:hypothetical protein